MIVPSESGRLLSEQYMKKECFFVHLPSYNSGLNTRLPSQNPILLQVPFSLVYYIARFPIFRFSSSIALLFFFLNKKAISAVPFSFRVAVASQQINRYI